MCGCLDTQTTRVVENTLRNECWRGHQGFRFLEAQQNQRGIKLKTQIKCVYGAR